MSMISSSQISPIFAYLPNGIIREIVSYTGATYKKRNGKYMGQIPKEDPRYNLLRTIPIGTVYFNEYGDPSEKSFHCAINLTRKPKLEGPTHIFYEITGYHHDSEYKILYTLTVYGGGIDMNESPTMLDRREYEYKEIIHPNEHSVRSQLEKVSSELGKVRLELGTIGERMERNKKHTLFCKNIAIGCTMFLVGNFLYMYRD
jgi:hypothetical protein